MVFIPMLGVVNLDVCAQINTIRDVSRSEAWSMSTPVANGVARANLKLGYSAGVDQSAPH